MPRPNLAGCVITDDEGRLLLIHRNTGKREWWEIPGGGIEPGETPKETAAREVSEELGIIVEMVEELGGEHFSMDGEQIHYTWVKAVIAGHSGEPRICEPEVHDRWGFFPLAELEIMASELSPNARNFVEAVLSQRVSLGYNLN